MVTGIQQTYDSRARLVNQMQEITLAAAKEGRALTQEENEKWAKMEADERQLTAAIEAYEKTEKLVQERAAKHFEQTPTQAKGQEWVSDSTARQDEGLNRDYRQAYTQFLREGFGALTRDQKKLIETRGTNTQVVGTDNLGGYGVPDYWQAGIEKAMLSYSGILAAADIMRTSGGNTLYFVTEDDTTTSAVKIAEAGSFTVQDVTYGQKHLDAYKYGSLVKVSWELLQDSAYNPEEDLTATFAARFGRALNTECTTGDGSGDPNGVVTATSAGKTAASATAITFAEIIDLIHSIDPAYRSSPRFGLMFHDTVLAYMKKLSIGSSDARPLWQPSFREGEPDRIDGHRYWINQAMDSSINASSKLILAGDFSKYKIRIAQDMRMKRLDELYSADGLVGFQAWMRFDGELMNTAAIKHLITAAS